MEKMLVLLIPALLLLSCGEDNSGRAVDHSSKQGSEKIENLKFDIQGHRGARGYYPENTLAGFKIAIDQGVTTLEMDVIITKDKQVILSHEPWLSHSICLDPDGNSISEENEKSFNMYQMNYEAILEFDCGSKGNPRFPEQEKLSESKPRLAEIIAAVEKYVSEKGLNPVFYNIETKSSPKGDNIFHPEPKEFVELLLDVVKEGKTLERTTIQSFDIRTLKEVHQIDSEISLALLVGGEEDGIAKLDKLGFVPAIYSPNYELLDIRTIGGLKGKGVKIIPWTVNEAEDIQKLLRMGVDGIISDYPDRVVNALEEHKSAKQTI
ncbi:MAG: glycerophosphodiester phosphodiesterase [Bacteroidia bacterium]|nr:glycerophosphodiester phosphodiesterase [Bacteroidia bacterium]